MLTDIADESNRLLGIIENLLLLTRLGSGTPPEQEPQLIAHVTRNAVDGYRQHHPERCDLARGAAGADGGRGGPWPPRDAARQPPDQRDQVQPRARPRSRCVVESDEREACVRVMDRGIGIGDADASQLFTAFYRTEAAKMRTQRPRHRPGRLPADRRLAGRPHLGAPAGGRRDRGGIRAAAGGRLARLTPAPAGASARMLPILAGARTSMEAGR